VESRLARFLVDEALKTGPHLKSGAEVSLTTRKNELAAYLGTISETLSRTFLKLKNRGVIRIQKNRVTILNPELLRNLAEGMPAP
jgi:CRP/FNR family transcriptional regulator